MHLVIFQLSLNRLPFPEKHKYCNLRLDSQHCWIDMRQSDRQLFLCQMFLHIELSALPRSNHVLHSSWLNITNLTNKHAKSFKNSLRQYNFYWLNCHATVTNREISSTVCSILNFPFSDHNATLADLGTFPRSNCSTNQQLINNYKFFCQNHLWIILVHN